MELTHKLLLIVSILFFALLSALLINYNTLRKKQHFLQLLNATRLDPFDLAAYPTHDNQLLPLLANQKRVVFLGDSRAKQWLMPADTYPFQFFNRGINAQTSIQVAGRFEEHIVPLRPHFLILQVGINDVRLIPAFPQQQETIIANCKSNIQTIVSQAQDLGATVILTTIFPVGKAPLLPAFSGASSEVTSAIEDVNQFIATLASENVIILDTATLLANEKGLVDREYSQDYLHINDAGYSQLNEALIDLLISNNSPTK